MGKHKDCLFRIKTLIKPALTAEAMWKRDANSEDELDIKYRQHQEPQSVRDNMPTSSPQLAATNQTVDAEPVTPPASMGEKSDHTSTRSTRIKWLGYQ